jgi:cell division transport system ATP-binding protein
MTSLLRRRARTARPDAPVISMVDVGMTYPNGKVALADVNVAIPPGDFVFLVGPSGAGKSTFIRLLIREQLPTSGNVTVAGRDLLRMRRRQVPGLRRRIGIVFQDFRLLEHMTTWENIAMPLRVSGKRVSDYKEDVTDLLQWVGLGDRMHSYPSILSGGEKQRAAIARAVINKPELLLADEPTGNVDPQMARRLLRLFVELNRLGTSVVIATHDHQLMRQTKAPRLELHDGHVRIV